MNISLKRRKGLSVPGHIKSGTDSCRHVVVDNIPETRAHMRGIRRFIGEVFLIDVFAKAFVFFCQQTVFGKNILLLYQCLLGTKRRNRWNINKNDPDYKCKESQRNEQ